MTATAPDRMSVLARIDFLTATLHNVAALARDGYGVIRATANIVELTFPNCPAELVHLAIRYADCVRLSTSLNSANWAAESRAERRADIIKPIRDAAQRAYLESVTAGGAFKSAMEAHYASPSE